MLGGSASHNDMVHSRGSPKDYDNWATLLNDTSFNYSNVLKYFKRMETFVGRKYGPDGDGQFYDRYSLARIRMTENLQNFMETMDQLE